MDEALIEMGALQSEIGVIFRGMMHHDREKKKLIQTLEKRKKELGELLGKELGIKVGDTITLWRQSGEELATDKIAALKSHTSKTEDLIVYLENDGSYTLSFYGWEIEGA